MEASQIYKTKKYADLTNSLKREGYQVKVLAAEIGARGFVGASALYLMKQLSIEGREKTRALKAMAEAAASREMLKLDLVKEEQK